MATKLAQLGVITIATGSSSQQLTQIPTIAYSVLIFAGSSNLAPVAIGNSGVNVANSANVLSRGEFGELLGIGYLNGHEKYDLSTLWVAGTAGDKIIVSYTVRE